VIVFADTSVWVSALLDQLRLWTLDRRLAQVADGLGVALPN